jgi:pyrroline-5-carboxylate reductase
MRLQLVGGGRMGEALLAGLLAADWAPAGEVRVVEALAPRRVELTERFPDIEVTDTVGPAEGTVLATKPGDIAAACAALGADAGRVLSIAAGVRLADLEGALPSGTAVVRAMPNTPALVGAGAAAIAAGTAATDDDLAWAESILSAVGIVVRVAEPLLDAVTGLSGSGPADLAGQTLLGSARLLVEGDDGPEALRAAVTSPGGTTAAGLRALEQAGVRAAFLDAVVAATERSRELGGV